MNYLIQTIEIAGSKRCLECQDGRATAAFLTSDYLVSPYGPADNKADVGGGCGPWTVFDDEDGDEDTRGEFTFGVSCGISEVELTLTKGAGFFTAVAEIYLNGTLVETVALDETDSYVVTISLAERPCGNRITVFAYGDEFPAGTEHAIVTAEITATA